jgi:lysophospholipase L1-like esterase
MTEAGCGRFSEALGKKGGWPLMRRFFLVIVSVLALVVVPSTGATAQTTPLPRSIAAIGDSMTQAADVCCWYGDHPSNSWSTGSASWDGISSHYERVRALTAAIAGNNYNNSRSGARMSDAPGQAVRAVAQQAGYVTILMGANDVCTSSPSTMTSVDTFRAQLDQTLETLDVGLPKRSRVFVASIPDIYQLWQIYHTSLAAQLVWTVAGICQSMLALDRTEAQRQAVRDRNMAYNAVLQQECAKYERCRFDGGAVFGYQFGRGDVSTLDYFHPSLTGQARLAAITWARSWWG